MTDNTTTEPTEPMDSETPAEPIAAAGPLLDSLDLTDEQRAQIREEVAAEFDPGDGNAEAAKYRHRAKAAESAREVLTGKVEALQRVALDGLCDKAGIKTDAVLTVAELADLLAEDGTVDPGKVTEAVTAAQEKLGIAPIGKGAHVPSAGIAPGAAPTGDFAEAFGPARR